MWFRGFVLAAAGLSCVAQAADMKDIQSIEVTAQRLTVTTLPDRKVYVVDEDLQGSVGSAADILNDIPSVEVDADGLLALRGDSKVLILVDGKPSAQFAGTNAGLALQQFPANEIEKIEVMTTPPPQYKAEGSGGVINIITKKKKDPGLAGNLQLNVGNRDRAVTSASLSDRIGDLSLSTTVGFRKDVRMRQVEDDRLAVDPTTQDLVASQEGLHEYFHRLVPSIKGGADYQIDDSRSVGLSLSHRELVGHRTYDQIDISEFPGGSPYDIALRHSDGHEWNMAGGQELHFEQKLCHPNETLTLTAQRSTTRERERYFYTNTDQIIVGPPTYDDLHLDMDLVKNEISADYVFPSAKSGTWKAGYDFEEDHNDFNYQGDNFDSATLLPINNPAITNQFRYHQRVQAEYGSWQEAFDAFTLMTGARLEQTHIYTDQIIGGISGTQSYFRVYPSLHADYDLSAHDRLFFGLSRRISRPDPEELNGLLDYQDIHNLKQGNPDLRPQDTKGVEAGYGYESKNFNLSSTFYYRQIRDAVTTVTEVVSADVLLTIKENLPKSRSEGVEITSNGNLAKTLAYNVSANLFNMQIDAAPLGGTGLRTANGVNLKASLDYRPTTDDTGQISFTRSDRRLTPQGFIDAVNIVNLGYRHQLDSNLALVATLSDALNGQKQRRFIDTPTLSDAYQRWQAGQVLYLGFTYSFGAQKKAKGEGFDYDK
jgi:outer membrane receptor protein involved in Fe transport